jgi:hypothetical protein
MECIRTVDCRVPCCKWIEQEFAKHATNRHGQLLIPRNRGIGKTVETHQ